MHLLTLLPRSPSLLLAPLTLQLNAILSKADDWQFDSFALEAAANGRSLSCLGFHLIKRMGLVQAIGLDETKLARCEPV